MKFFARLRSEKRRPGAVFSVTAEKSTLLILLAGAGFAVFLFYGTWAQTFDLKNVGEMPERNTVYDVDGKIYSRLAGANRLKVSLSEVSPYFITAVLAREDVAFTSTRGLMAGICVALVRDITSGSPKEGASSITQQLARNSLPLGGRTLSRKLLEAMVALRIERRFTKTADSRALREPDLFRQRLLRSPDRVASVFRQERLQAEPSRSGTPGRIDPQPQSIFTAKESGRRKNPTQCRSGSYGGIEKTFVRGCRSRQAGEVAPRPRRMPFVQENYAMDAVQRDLNLILTQDQIDNGGLSINTTLDPAVQNRTDALERNSPKSSINPIFIIR